MVSQAQLIDRVQGMFVGLAVGDALGAPVEFGYTAKDIRVNWNCEMQDHRVPLGHYTDDTSMALCLADSLIEKNGYDSYDVMHKYSKWMYEGYRDSENRPAADVGNQTRGAINAFNEDPAIYKDNPKTLSAGNGGVMRLAPAIIASANSKIEHSIKLAMISSRETHNSDEANRAAEIFGAMLWNSLHIKDKQNIIDVAKYSTGNIYDGVLSRILQYKTCDRTDLEDLGGYVVDALKITIWGFMNFESFQDGLIAVIKLGGDTDTNGAIYGQLAGAYYGYQSISTKWRNDLLDELEIKNLASKLLEQQPCRIITTRFEEDGIDTFSIR